MIFCYVKGSNKGLKIELECINIKNYIVFIKNRIKPLTEEYECGLILLFTLAKNTTSYFGLLTGNDLMVLCSESAICK